LSEPYQISAHERAIGCLLAAAFGDALGWPHEARAHRVREGHGRKIGLVDWVKRSGGRFQPHEEVIQAGSYSDDTQLILAVARARLTGEGWWDYLARVELPFWTQYERGGGGASLRAARLLLKGVLPWEAHANDQGKYQAAGGNGAAMRVAPHCIFNVHQSDFRPIAVEVMSDSVLTHGHPRALVGALAYSFALWTALRSRRTLEYGELVEQVADGIGYWADIPDLSGIWPTWHLAVGAPGFYRDWNGAVGEMMDGLKAIRTSLSNGALAIDEETLESLGCFDPRINGSGTVSALSAIFLGSKHAASPFEGVARAAFAKGADTDTIASMTGALVGAVNGYDWLSQAGEIQDHVYIADTAQQLLSGSASWTRAAPFSNAASRKFVADLRSGKDPVTLPIGGMATAQVYGGVRSMLDRTQAESWCLFSEFGQTFFVKKLSSAHSERTQDLPHNATAAFVGIGIAVKDLARSRVFYERLAGLSVTKESATRLQFGSAFALREHQGEVVPGAGITFYIGVGDINRSHKAIVASSGYAASPIVNKSGRTSFACRDPDGYVIEFFQTQ